MKHFSYLARLIRVNYLLVKLSKILKDRQVRKIVYFHADHFEPFTGPGRVYDLRGIDKFISTASKYKNSKKLSLT